ncbi:MAG: hypothetical protein VKJ24_03865 [Synechococcales bacterium]|nr:hypothetical protein [Synechococcales bacterium]
MPQPKPLQTFRSEFPDVVPHSYTIFIMPLAWIQAFLGQIYDFVIHLLWQHLTQGRRYKTVGAIVGMLLFCSLSVLSYLLREQDFWLLLASIALWLAERWLVRSQYGHSHHKISTQLIDASEECLRWEWRSHRDQIVETFEHDRLRGVALHQQVIRGGCFDIELATVWQVCLRLTDDRNFLIYQEQNAAQALRQGQRLADYFQLPIWFADSQGDSPYAIEPLDLHGLRSSTRFPSTIRVQHSAQQWKIVSKWNGSSAWNLLAQIVQESGFLLFVVIIINLMIMWGKLLYTIAMTIWAGSMAAFTWGINETLFSWLLQDFDWLEVGEFGFAIALMVFKGAELSKEEHLYLSPQGLRAFLDHQKLGEMSLNAIVACLWIQKPQPFVLIVGKQEAIELPGLQREIEFRAVVMKVQEAITQLRLQE